MAKDKKFRSLDSIILEIADDLPPAIAKTFLDAHNEMSANLKKSTDNFYKALNNVKEKEIISNRELPLAVDWSNYNKGAGGFADNLEDARNSAKKIKDYTMGFDELNVIKISEPVSIVNHKCLIIRKVNEF